MSDDALDEIDEDAFEDDGFLEMTCGRFDNGRLAKGCALAGTEFCDWDCPYSGKQRIGHDR